MRAIRRLLQVVAVVGTLLVGAMALALIVSQTPWFRDWLRRYIVRESKQYLNGELAIGAIGGNLLFGVQVSDVAVDVSGERVIAVKALELDYSVFQLVSSGVVLDEIKLVSPTVRVERHADGWNLGRLVKKQRQEADRKGPGRPIEVKSIEVSDASVVIDDGDGTNGYELPKRIEDLDIKASYAYAPVHYSVTIDRASFRASSPRLTLSGLSGEFAIRDDNAFFENIVLKLAETSVTVDGVVEQYLKTPVIKATATGQVSLPEIARVLPAAEGYALHPAFTVKATGPADRLDLVLDVKSEAGSVRGQVTADVKAPDLAASGEVDVARLNLAPILKNPTQKSDITGHAKIDLRLASAPTGAPVVERLNGTFAFQGPRVTAAGYQAANVRATGGVDGPRLSLDARADAYGARGTAAGVIVLPGPRRPVRYELRGRAEGVDVRKLTTITGAPPIATHLSVAQYHVKGSGRTVSGEARLNESTVEGATVAGGTSVQFQVVPATVTYAAKGSVANLNLQRIGRVLKVPALDKPAYDSALNGDFDVNGSVPRGARPGDTAKLVTVDATGTLRDTRIMGGTLPDMAFETLLSGGTLDLAAKGRFEGFDPATLAAREEVKGRITGTVDARARLADISAPLTPETFTADGSVNLEKSEVGGLQIESAAVNGKYAAEIADVSRLDVEGPDLKVKASGRLALDRTSASNLEYHIEALDLGELGKLAGRDGLSGSAVLDGRVTGNRGSLVTTGTVDGSNMGVGNTNVLDANSQYTATIPELTFAAAKIEATTNATFVKLGALQLNEVAATTTYEKQHLAFKTNVKQEARELDATGEVIFHPDHQEVHLPELAIRTQGVEWRTRPGGAATIRYGGNLLQLNDIRLISGDQALDVSGTLALTDRAGAKPSGVITVKASNVDLQQLETLLLRNDGFFGKLSADATITGFLNAPAIDGHVEIRDGAFKAYKYQSLTADIDYGADRIGIDATLQQSAAEAITAKGSVPTSLFRPSGAEHIEAVADPVDLTIKSTPLGLGIVQGVTDQVANVAGTLEVDVRVTGSGRDPHLSGFVDIKDGAFAVPAGGVSYTGLNTRIELEPEKVRLQRFTIHDEHGQPLNVSGELATHERSVGAVTLALNSDNFEVIDNELGDVGLDSSIEITGELRRPRVVGQIRVEAGRLEVDRILQLFYDPYSVESLPEVQSAERIAEVSGSAEEAAKVALAKAGTSAAAPGAKEPGAPTPPGGVFGPLAMDVRLVIPDNLVLRGKNLRPGGPTGTALGNINITVGGDLIVRKDPGGQVRLFGEVETIRGTYEFQGRRFDLARGGRLRFAGEPTINPTLDVTATRLIPNTGVEVRVRITGSAQRPSLQLSSDPPLDESDILSLIVFNRPVNELGAGERGSLAATAGGIATGFLAAPLGESIGRALDLDLFEITTATDEGELGAGLTIGQQIGDKAFVKLRQQFGERNITEFLLEYQLTDILRIRTTAAPETSGSANRINQRRVERAGIDLIFFFSY